MNTVLYYIPGATYGGAHNQVLKLADPLQALGYVSVVLLPQEPGDAAERLRSAGIDVVTAPLRRLRAVATPTTHLRLLRSWDPQVKLLKELMDSIRPAIIQLHGVTSVDGFAAARASGRPVVWQLLDTRAPRLLRLALRPILLKADCIMTVGRSLARQYPGVSTVRPVSFYPPVRSEDFALDAEQRRMARRRMGICDRTTLVVSLGNFNPQKDHRTVLRGFAECMNEGGYGGGYASLRIRGSISSSHPNILHSLRYEAARLGLPPETVSTLEEGVSPAGLLAAADLFVLMSKSRSEGVPTVLLEALAAGLPLIASDVGGSHEVLNVAPGRLVRHGSVSDLAAAMAPYLQRGLLPTASREEAQTVFSRYFDINKTVSAYVHAYSRALGF